MWQGEARLQHDGPDTTDGVHGIVREGHLVDLDVVECLDDDVLPNDDDIEAQDPGEAIVEERRKVVARVLTVKAEDEEGGEGADETEQGGCDGQKQEIYAHYRVACLKSFSTWIFGFTSWIHSFSTSFPDFYLCEGLPLVIAC